MRSNMNFKGYEDATNNNGSNKPPPANHPTLMSQSSIYSLTFDEFLTTIGGLGKDFGSMNMDELLKNIWTAEETQSLAMSSSNNNGGEASKNNTTMISSNNSNSNYYYGNPNGNLQRQGSLTLPRTLSQKTVDEVWRDLMKESGGDGGGANTSTKDNSGGAVASASAMPQRQQTLGEMTLEEFLVRAGVVREDNNNNNHNNNNSNVPLQIGRPAQWFNNDNAGLMLGFEQQQPNMNLGNTNSMVNSNNPVSKQPPTLSLQVSATSNHMQQQNHQQPRLFPKPANVAFPAAAMHLMNASHQLDGRGGGGMIGVQGGGGLTVAGSPTSQISPAAEGMARSKGDGSLHSPVPYVINRPRKYSAMEKVVERRQRRMIKNRESAARSRARKQAYTLELEAEVEKLKILNRELKRKQAKFVETKKDTSQALVTLSGAWGGKRQCLRRTLTGPW